MAVRLLCDEHVGKKHFYPQLRSNWYCRHVLDERTLGSGASDTEIWKFAASKNLTVLTNDTDFQPGGSANPGNGTYPGVIYYDDDVAVSDHIDAIRAIDQHMSTAQIASYHEQKGQVLYSPGSWA